MSEHTPGPSEYEERWYWCDITEVDPDAVEPLWERVPEDRREMVRQRWQAKETVTRKFKLWGPQIPLYAESHGMTVDVVGPVSLGEL